MKKEKCPWCESENTQMHLWVKDLFLTQEPFEIHECLNCGLLFTEPRPPQDQIGKYYKSEEYYSHQENKKGLVPKLYEAVKIVNLRAKVKMATEGLQKGKMLEIGCGAGDFIHQMEEIGWECTGVEPSEDAQTIAKKRVKGTLLKPDDITKLEDEDYDLIVMWQVLEHVDNLREEVQHLYRLLKKGGRLVIAVPNFKSADAQHYKEFWGAYDVPRHLNHFCQESIRNIFKDSGLVLQKTNKLRWDAYYISYLGEKYLNHSLPLIKGAIRGFISNCKALSSGEWSSMVYLFQKK